VRSIVVALLVSIVIGCAGDTEPDVRKQPAQVDRRGAQSGAVQMLPAPAGAGAVEPFLSATRDGVLLSWLEPVVGTDRVALKFSRYAGGQWTAPRAIIERNDLFVNWADFPSIIEDARGTLFAHWLQKSGKGTYSYDVRLATSADGGTAWGQPFLLNRDGKEAEHGFVSLSALAGGGIAATWLDGRNMSGGHGDESDAGDMSLRYATVDANGTIASDFELDGRTCECCTTGMAIAASGPVIAYRDRTADEVRDISVVRKTSSGWTRPQPLHKDGWKIAGCPVNGPQVDARSNGVVVAWFTAARDVGRAYVAFSADGGSTFGNPLQIDDGKPAGRLDVVMLDDDAALVTWLEQTTAGAEIRARRVTRAGKPDNAVKIADSTTARAAGFPRIARTGNDVFLAWTEHNATTKRIHVARIRF
jgi:hypothetical protein